MAQRSDLLGLLTRLSGEEKFGVSREKGSEYRMKQLLCLPTLPGTVLGKEKAVCVQANGTDWSVWK